MQLPIDPIEQDKEPPTKLIKEEKHRKEKENTEYSSIMNLSHQDAATTGGGRK